MQAKHSGRLRAMRSGRLTAVQVFWSEKYHKDLPRIKITHPTVASTAMSLNTVISSVSALRCLSCK